MREEYDFTESVPNPYAQKLKEQVTICLEADVVDYFKALAEETDIPYQTLINLYLKDCMKAQRKPSLEWVN
ncbi:MAG: BrnA antitoxin family protein [Cyanobacteria bacterium P01_C01_bin.120]